MHPLGCVGELVTLDVGTRGHEGVGVAQVSGPTTMVRKSAGARWQVSASYRWASHVAEVPGEDWGSVTWRALWLRPAHVDGPFLDVDAAAVLANEASIGYSPR